MEETNNAAAQVFIDVPVERIGDDVFALTDSGVTLVGRIEERK